MLAYAANEYKKRVFNFKEISMVPKHIKCMIKILVLLRVIKMLHKLQQNWQWSAHSLLQIDSN